MTRFRVVCKGCKGLYQQYQFFCAVPVRGVVNMGRITRSLTRRVTLAHAQSDTLADAQADTLADTLADALTEKQS